MLVEATSLLIKLNADEYSKVLNDNKKIIDEQLDVCFNVFKTYDEKFRIRDLKIDRDVSEELNEKLKKVAQVVCKIREIACNTGDKNLVDKSNQHLMYLRIVEQICIKQFELVKETSSNRQTPFVPIIVLYGIGYKAGPNSNIKLVVTTLFLSALSMGFGYMHIMSDHEKLMNLYKSKTDANVFWQ